jgi:hypothetical protein
MRDMQEDDDDDADDYTDSLAIDALIEEYKIVSRNRDNHMKAYTQTNFYFGLIVATLGLAVLTNEGFFLILPYMIVIQYSIVQWNQYHTFLAEVFLEELEHKINKKIEKMEKISPGLNYFKYYNLLFDQKALIKDHIIKIPLIKPTALLSATLAVVNICLVIYSVSRGLDFLDHLPVTGILPFFYLLSISVLLCLVIYNFMRMPQKIKPILRNVLNHNLK